MLAGFACPCCGDNWLMRIVHVATSPQPDGFSTALRHLGAGYQRAGHQFTAIVGGDAASRAETASGTRITVRAAASAHGFVATAEAVRRILTELAPQRLEVSDRLGLRGLGVWAEANSVPAVMVLPGAAPAWLIRVVPDLVGYHHAVCTSADVARTLSSAMPGRVAEVRMGVDLVAFSPLRWSADARHRHLGANTVLLVSTGRLSPANAPHLAIEALDELLHRGIDSRLIVVGEGPLRPRLVRQAAGLPVDFVGRLPDERAFATLLASADVFIEAGRDLAGNLAALESLAAGTPVVVSAGAGFPAPASWQSDGPTGRQFADAIERVLHRPVENRRTQARALAARQPWRSTVAGMLAVHDVVTAGIVASVHPAVED